MELAGKKPLISIVIVTFNRALYLPETLDSIFSQDMDGYEVIAVNASDDNTDEILSRYPVRNLRQDASLPGVAEARNIGMNAAMADIVAFIDDDATADRSWLRYLIKPLMDDATVGCTGGTVLDHASGKVQFRNGTITVNGSHQNHDTPQEYWDRNGYLFSIVRGANMAFNKKIAMEVGAFDPYFRDIAEETDMALRIVLSGYKCVHTPDSVVLHKTANGPRRKSEFGINWFNFVKCRTYFLMKNFYTIRGPLITRVSTVYAYFRIMAFLVLIFLRRRTTLGDTLGYIWDITRGYQVGYGDIMKEIRAGIV